jgi:hypothetical protein
MSEKTVFQKIYDIYAKPRPYVFGNDKIVQVITQDEMEFLQSTFPTYKTLFFWQADIEKKFKQSLYQSHGNFCPVEVAKHRAWIHTPIASTWHTYWYKRCIKRSFYWMFLRRILYQRD